MRRNVGRREFVSMVAASALGGVPAACGARSGSGERAEPGEQWRMPDESRTHARTWMAFVANPDIWGRRLVPEVRRNLAEIARAIAHFEPVSMLVRADEHDEARRLVGPEVDLFDADVDDLWLRDTGPVFVQGHGGAHAAVDFNFNGWGNKQQHQSDSHVAAVVAQRAGVPLLHTGLVLEGGALEVDGEGTAIITESCVLNDNRNPGWTKENVEAELGRLLGIRKALWLPGIAGHDITDGHTDFYARFTSPGVVVAGRDNDPDSFDYEVTRRHLELLTSATDAAGRRLRVEVLDGPATIRPRRDVEDFAAGYINFYVCNGGVIAPQFGDPAADSAARDTLQRLFPGRGVVQLDIDGIAAGGGGIHCTTQQEPIP